MIVATALAMALLGHRHAAPPETRRYETGGWVLTVDTDRFTGAILCSVRSRSVVVHRDTAIFQLDRHVDTDQAQFRIDGGAARGVQDVTLENARHGIFPERGWLENPSGGEVALPVSDVEGAKRIFIRARRHGPIQAFDVGRLGQILRSAAGLGCPAAAL